jgi:hypothetical protein
MQAHLNSNVPNLKTISWTSNKNFFIINKAFNLHSHTLLNTTQSVIHQKTSKLAK